MFELHARSGNEEGECRRTAQLSADNPADVHGGIARGEQVVLFVERSLGNEETELRSQDFLYS